MALNVKKFNEIKTNFSQLLSTISVEISVEISMGSAVSKSLGGQVQGQLLHCILHNVGPIYNITAVILSCTYAIYTVQYNTVTSAE